MTPKKRLRAVTTGQSRPVQNPTKARRRSPASQVAAALVTTAFALMASAFPSTAPAQDMKRFEPGPGDRADAPAPGHDALHQVSNTLPAIRTCLSAKTAAGEDRAECLGLTMNVCLKFSVNQTTLGSIRCAHGEAEAWTALANEAMEGAMAKGDTGVRDALNASQNTWIAHQRAACGVWGEVFRGGSIARQIGADCMREEAGRRALALIAVKEALDL